MDVNEVRERPRRRARARWLTGLAVGATSLIGFDHAWCASVPWMPSIDARDAIELLVDSVGLQLTTSQWPLPRDAVQQALDALAVSLPPAQSAARDRVQAELRAQRGARLAVTTRGHADALPGFGDDATPGSSLALRSGELDGPHLALQVGGRLEAASDPAVSGRKVRLDDSAVAVDALGVQAQIWAHRSWWGPGWQNALALSNNTPALDGIGLQRASAARSASPWLSWLGPWSAEFFVARSEGQAQAPGSNPLISGARITFRPLSFLELGVTRMSQWGGYGRRETLGAFAEEMLGRHQNADTTQKQAIDPGNGLAGYDLRARCPAGLRCTVYGQFIGEDEAGGLPTKFLTMLGGEAWSADGRDRFFVEAVETGCRNSWTEASLRGCAYRNYAYPGGYTSNQRWLGASVGPDSRLLTLGWMDADWNSVLRLDLGRVGAQVGTYSPQVFSLASSPRLLGVSARRSFDWGASRFTPEFDWMRLSGPGGVHVEPRVGLEMSVALDDLGPVAPRHFGDMLSLAPGRPAVQGLAVAAALIGGAALFDRAADRFAVEHQHDPATKALRSAGDLLPYAGLGLAGVAWLALDDPTQRNVALTSVESGLAAVALTEATRYAVDRSRPSQGRGAFDFGHERRSDSSFPSAHAALAWGVLTPVARQYDAPWLYGVAALTNFARVAGRDHWLSDTVAGSVLGYVVGDWFWRRSDAARGAATTTSVMLMPHGVALSTSFR